MPQPPEVSSWYLDALAEKVQQGDIYRPTPSLYLVSRPVEVARPQTLPGGDPGARLFFEDGDSPPDGWKWDRQLGRDEWIISRGILDCAILLTWDCEIDWDAKHRIVALLRPWSKLPETSQKAVLAGDHHCFFYLKPDAKAGLPESYADFRRLTTMRPAALPDKNRILSLTEPIRQALAVAFVAYITGRVPKVEV